MCASCRGRQEECLRQARACLEPGPGRQPAEATWAAEPQEPTSADLVAQGRTGLPETDPDPGPDLAACRLCEAPIASGHYCPACQRRVGGAVAAYERQAP